MKKSSRTYLIGLAAIFSFLVSGCLIQPKSRTAPVSIEFNADVILEDIDLLDPSQGTVNEGGILRVVVEEANNERAQVRNAFVDSFLETDNATEETVCEIFSRQNEVIENTDNTRVSVGKLKYGIFGQSNLLDIPWDETNQQYRSVFSANFSAQDRQVVASGAERASEFGIAFSVPGQMASVRLGAEEFMSPDLTVKKNADLELSWSRDEVIDARNLMYVILGSESESGRTFDEMHCLVKEMELEPSSGSAMKWKIPASKFASLFPDSDAILVLRRMHYYQSAPAGLPYLFSITSRRSWERAVKLSFN